MDSEPDFNLGLTSTKPGLPTAGGVQEPSETPIEESLGGVPGDAGHLFKSKPLFRCGPGELVDEHRSRNPAAAIASRCWSMA